MRIKLAGVLSLSCLAVLLFLSLPSGPLFAGSAPSACTGSYLIQEDGGAKDFWTFEADGSFLGTTSTQPLYNFSNQQGTWEKDGADGAKGTLLAFVFDGDNNLLTTARIDVAFHTVGHGCDHIAGSLVVRTFEDGEDPLDPSTDTGDPLATDTFSGRRVKAGE